MFFLRDLPNQYSLLLSAYCCFSSIKKKKKRSPLYYKLHEIKNVFVLFSAAFPVTVMLRDS